MLGHDAVHVVKVNWTHAWVRTTETRVPVPQLGTAIEARASTDCSWPRGINTLHLRHQLRRPAPSLRSSWTADCNINTWKKFNLTIMTVLIYGLGSFKYAMRAIRNERLECDRILTSWKRYQNKALSR